MKSTIRIVLPKVAFALLILLLQIAYVNGQDQKVKLYDPTADGTADLNKAIQEAKETDKHVLVQIGGNWCGWCIKFHNFCKENEQISSIIKDNYVVLRVNYDQENKNPDVLKRLEYPQRFGFPVLIIVDGSGRRLHTQDSALLEKESSYDEKRVLSFFKGWTPDAVSSDPYQ